jgi:spore maturation protein B
MMQVMSAISSMMIPSLILFIIVYGIQKKKNIFDIFIKGAKEGLNITVQILPSLIGLMVAVGILRASGLLDQLSKIIEMCVGDRIPPAVIPVAIVRLFSASGATGLLLDIFKKFGTDSREGLTAALLLSSTETLVYCMSIYFGSVGIKKTRYTIPGALIATLAGTFASVVLANYMLP